MADLDEVEANSVSIEDPLTGDTTEVFNRAVSQRIKGDNGYILEPNSNGSLPVTTVVTPPPDTTPVTQSDFQNTGSTTGIDTAYTITNDTVLKITSFDGGAEFNAAGSVVELFEDPNGNAVGMIRIATIFVNASSTEQSIDEDFIGDGTRRILLRIRAYGGGVREIAGRWRGYED